MAAKRTLAERESLLRLLDSPHSDQTVTQYLTSQGMSQLYNTPVSYTHLDVYKRQVNNGDDKIAS